MRRTTLLFLTILAGVLPVACGDDKRGISPTGSTETNGIVVERITLRSKSCATPCIESCRIEGTVRNDRATDRKATIAFQAFDGSGQVICWIICTTSVEVVVPAGGRADFSELFTSVGFHDCDRVARVEIMELESEPIA